MLGMFGRNVSQDGCRPRRPSKSVKSPKGRTQHKQENRRHHDSATGNSSPGESP